MRYGVVSDIHANIQAWNAVLRDMKKQGVDVILCLGDVVGYGPNPAEVLDSCYEHVDYFILGNHDAVIGNRLDSSLFNDNAKYLIEWTRDQLNPAACDLFSDMPLRMEGDGFVCAHGELALPGRFGYIYEAQDAIESFTSNESPLMFVGHTHFPAKFVLDTNNNSVRKDLPGDSFLLPNERYLINAGSVGDPRDGNTAASYCIYDTDQKMVKFRQVPFDIEGFRNNLLNAQLPVNPFFIRVYDGQQGETETIKDMKVMANNQTTEASPSAQRVIKVGDDVKKRRKKLNFSMDDVRQTRHFKAQEATRREAEAVQKKKGKTVVIALVVALFVVFGIVIAVVKSNQPTTNNNDVVNQVPDYIKEDVVVINQEKGKDLVLAVDKAKTNDDTKIDEASGMLTGWKAQTSRVEWNVRVKEKGWYELFIEHAKKDSDATVRLKMGFTNYDVTLAATKEGALEEQSLGYFETEDLGQMSIALIALKPGAEAVTNLKSVKLRFHGDIKPNPYGELDDVVFEDFSKPYFDNDWVIKGRAFPHRPLSKSTISPLISVKGVNGDYCAGSINSLHTHPDTIRNVKGTMISKKFIIKHRYIHMLARGGDGTSVEVAVKGRNAFSQKPPYSAPIQLKPFSFDVTDYLGEEARLIFRDIGGKNLVFDNIIFSNKEVADLPSSRKEIKKARPVIIESKSDPRQILAGKKLIKGELNAAINALLKKDKTATKVPENHLDTSLFKGTVLKFDELQLKSKKEITQNSDKVVNLKDCGDKELITLNKVMQGHHKFKWIQTNFYVRSTGRRKAIGMGGGNICLTNYAIQVTRKELMNKGRYVRVSLENKKEYLSLAEVQIISDGKNIALKKVASQSSVSNNGPAALAIDGNTNGDHSKGSVSHTESEYAPWWMVDLGSVHKIDSIKIFNRVDKDAKVNQRLDRYTVSILDENKNIIWQNFKLKAEKENTHEVKTIFEMSFAQTKATYSQNHTHPKNAIKNSDPNVSWAIAGGEKKDQKLWYGVKQPFILNPGDKISIKLNFNTKHKKHVAGKMKFIFFSTDDANKAEIEEKLKPFVDLDSAIVGSFRNDLNKHVQFSTKGGADVKVKVVKVTDNNLVYLKDANGRTYRFTVDKFSSKEKEKRIKAMENGEVIWAFHNGGLQGNMKGLKFNKETFIGKLLDAGSKVYVAKHDPMILTGRYIEVWHQNMDGKPTYSIEVNSSGQIVTKMGKTSRFKEIYPDYPSDQDFDVQTFDLGTMRNINSIKFVKKDNGKIPAFSVAIKNKYKKVIWQNSWYHQFDLFSNNGVPFGIDGVYKKTKDVNLAKGAKIVTGEAISGWNGLTDGFEGAINPFAHASKAEPPYELVLDLGEEKVVNAFRAFKNSTSAFNGIQVAYSLDNKEFTDLGAVSTVNNGREVIFWSIKEQPVRYVKLKFLNNYSTFKYKFLLDKVVLSEFEVLKL